MRKMQLVPLTPPQGTLHRPSGMNTLIIRSLCTLVLTSTALVSQTALMTFYGDSIRERLGESVAGAGDVNADGYPDLIVGAPGDDRRGPYSGTVYVYSGRDGSTLFTRYGIAPHEYFGTAVGGAGDINLDGHADWIVGTPQADIGKGRVDVYSGRDGTVLYTFRGVINRGWLGAAVAGAGDLNRDGHPDFIISSHGYYSQLGFVRAISGKDGSILFTVSAIGQNEFFGTSVSSAGDVNQDGYPDVIVGAHQLGRNHPGYVRVYSGLDGSVLHTFQGTENHDNFGCSVSGIGDVNNDGHPDLVIGAFGENTNGSIAGSASIYSGLDGSRLLIILGDKAGDMFGWAVSGIGDTNGDGHADFAVGIPRFSSNTEPGEIRVFSGRDGLLIQSIAGVSRGDRFGFSVACAGDVDKDGRTDVISGASYANKYGVESGRASVHKTNDGSVEAFGSGCKTSVFSPGSACLVHNVLTVPIPKATTKNLGHAFELVAPKTLELIGFQFFSFSLTGPRTLTAGLHFADPRGKPGPLVATGILDLTIDDEFQVALFDKPYTIPSGTKFFVSYQNSAVDTLHFSQGGGTLIPHYELLAGVWTRTQFANAWSLQALCLNGYEPSMIHVDNVPEVGQTMTVQLSGARPLAPTALATGISKTSWGAAALPFDLSPLGATSCTVYTDALVTLNATTDASGAVTLVIQVPNDQALHGLNVYQQFITIDPIANRLGVTTTGAVELVVGG